MEPTASAGGSLGDTLAVFEEARGEPLTTREVAEAADCTRRTAYDRLDRLADRGAVRTKKVGARGRVWWRPAAAAGGGADGAGESDAFHGGDGADDAGSGDRDDGTTVAAADDATNADEATAVGDATAGAVAAEPGAGAVPTAVLDAADVAVFVLDADYRVAWASRGVERYFGLDRDAVVGRDKRAVVRESVAPAVADGDRFVETVLPTYGDGAGPQTFECRVTAGPDREERWLEHRSRPLETGRFAAGRVEVYYDVTERKRSERALRRNERRLRSLVDAVEEYAIVTLDADGRVASWNEGAAVITGYERAAVLGEHVATFYPPEDAADGVPEATLARADEEGSVVREGWQVRADGSRFWASVTVTALRDDDGTVEGYAMVTRDMTERRERERELRAERNRLERVLETSPIGIAVFADDGSTVAANAEAADLLGVPPDAVEVYELGDRVIRDADGEVLPYDERPIARVFDSGEPVSDVEVLAETADGDPLWASVDAAPLETDGDEVRHVVAAMTDITRLKEQSRALASRRDELERELEEVFDRVDDAFFALNEDMEFVYVNDRAETVLERTAGELLGRGVWDAFPEATETIARDRFETAMETQEPVHFDLFYDPLGIWVDAHVYPSESGLSVYFRDVSERKERERELERYETVVETVGDGIYVLDDGYHFTKVNDAYCELTGYDREELLGSHCSLVVGDDVSATAAAVSEELAADGTSETIEAEIHRADGETVTAESRFTALPAEDGRFRGTVGVVRDVSERKERERELERYETVVETVGDGIYAQDPDGRFTMVNDAFCEMTGYDRDRIVGAHSTLVHSEAVDEEALELAAGIGDGETATLEFDLQPRAGDPVPVESRFAPYDYDGETAYTGVVRDVSERKQFEETLTALHDTSRRLLDATTTREVSETVVETAAGTLDLPGVAVYRYDDEEDVLVREAASLVERAFGGGVTRLPADDDSIAGGVFTEGRARRFDDVRESPDIYDGVGDTPIRGALFVPLSDHGVFLAGSREVGGIDDETHQLVDLLAANAVAAYDRVDREEQLRHQRDRLRALDDLNAVVRGINEALAEQSSREEVAEVVCERLAASDSYRFAWFGDVNPKTGAVESEIEVGVDDYLPEIEVATGPDDDVPDGPISRAVRTHEVQVVDDAFAESTFEPWREYAREYGYRSAAAVPVVHEGTLYGLVGVYSDQPGAFGGEQRAVVGQLRTVVGHALAAIERKRALMSDEVVEVEFRIPDVFEVVGAETATDGTVRFDRAVPAGDDSYLVYGTAEAAAVDGLRTLVDRQPHWEALSVLAREDDAVAFELGVDDPPVVSMVAARGGYLEGATVEDGDYHMTLHLPPGGGVRQVIDAVEESYPAAELLTRRQVTRSGDSTEPVGRALVDRLTDRQRAALEAAFYSGYFEWPRDSTGEDVADSLGVSAPTFHQHVRHAQQKLLAALYEGG